MGESHQAKPRIESVKPGCAKSNVGAASSRREGDCSSSKTSKCPSPNTATAKAKHASDCSDKGAPVCKAPQTGSCCPPIRTPPAALAALPVWDKALVNEEKPNCAESEANSNSSVLPTPTVNSGTSSQAQDLGVGKRPAYADFNAGKGRPSCPEPRDASNGSNWARPKTEAASSRHASPGAETSSPGQAEHRSSISEPRENRWWTGSCGPNRAELRRRRGEPESA